MQSVVVVGLGNIGSHLVRHLARMPGVARVTLIDRDVYEEKNLRSQDITRRAVGRAKAAVQARQLRRINPALAVVAIGDTVENVPLGLLRGAIVLGCLDSRATRRYLAAAAWHAGAVAYIDAGVEPTGQLARVNLYVAGPAACCFECTWEAADYAAQDQRYPCDGPTAALGPPSIAATNAPSSLGALAAALQAIECGKLLDGAVERALVGRQVVLDASWHKHYVTTLRRNPSCRFDHQMWRIEALPVAATIAAAIALGDGHATLKVPGRAFVRRLTCTACGRSRTLLYLWGRLRSAARTCATCGAPMLAAGFDMAEHVRASDLPSALLERPLAHIGLLPGDIFAVSSACGDRYFQLAPNLNGA